MIVLKIIGKMILILMILYVHSVQKYATNAMIWTPVFHVKMVIIGMVILHVLNVFVDVQHVLDH